MTHQTVPGIEINDAKKLIDVLQDSLVNYNDLSLILKHAHWNVTGPDFIAVHEMLDPQIDTVREYADEVAERIATLGGEPIGTPAGHIEGRTPLQYTVNRAGTLEHIKALDEVYTQVITTSREAIAVAGDIDPITEDLFIGQVADLEKFQWFLRAHLGY